MQVRKSPVRITAICLLLAALTVSAHAWGPHPDITRAALEVLPDKERWREVLGGQYDALAHYSWMPDQAGQDFGDYYPDDYLLVRAFPRYVGHMMPTVREAWEPYFRRALQGLRTETPVNAARQMGPIIHFVEDSGAPPHARPIGSPHHGPLENWVDRTLISIPDYQPQLLGTDDDSAVEGLMERVDRLVEFSIERADRALPLVERGEEERPNVEPIILESALESARATADVLHTLFTVAFAHIPEGGGLQGTVTTGVFHPGAENRNRKGARIILLHDEPYRAPGGQPASLMEAVSDYSTVAYTAPDMPDDVGWQGAFEFRNLTPGVYRALAYRTGSQWVVSEPVDLEVGRTTELHLDLPPAEPEGNIIQNPDGTLAYLHATPDRWRHVAGPRWVSRVSAVQDGLAYRCGAILRDPTVKVSFEFRTREDVEVIELETGQAAPPEETFLCEQGGMTVAVIVETALPLTEAIERVWVTPVEAQGR